MRNWCFSRAGATDLGEADVLGLLTEALTADVEAVLADETSLVGADTAVGKPMLAPCSSNLPNVPPISLFTQSFTPLFQRRVDAPFAAALAVGARARVPDRLVRHVDGCLSCG